MMGMIIDNDDDNENNDSIIHISQLPMKKSPKKLPQTPPQPHTPTSIPNPLSPSPSPQIQKILTIRDTFHKTIQTPIQHIQAIQHSKTPQRCLIHNTILTLYCQIDRKVLCASCMYQQDTHRKHRVVPLGRAVAMVKEDILGFEIKLEGNLSQCSSLSRKLQQLIIKNQRLYPSTISTLKSYYTNLIQTLHQKQQQQISQIKQHHEKLKKQILFFDQEIKKISTLIANKFKPTKKVQTQDLLVTRRSVLEILTKVHRILNVDVVDVFGVFQGGTDQAIGTGTGGSNRGFPGNIGFEPGSVGIVDFDMFQDVEEMIKRKLIVVLPGISVQTRANIFSHSPNKRTQSKSPQPLHNHNHNPSPKKPQNRPHSTSNPNLKKPRKQVTFNLN